MSTVVSDISDYLTAPTSYGYGLILLKKTKCPESIVDYLKLYENKPRLLKELSIYLKSPKNEATKTEETAAEIQPRRDESDTVTESLSQYYASNGKEDGSDLYSSDSNLDLATDQSFLLEKLLQNRIILMRKRGHLHGRLHGAIDDATRYSIAKDLYRVQKDIDQCHADRNELLKGCIPRSIALESMSAKDYKKYRNIQSYISRYSSLLSDPDLSPEDKSNYSDLLNKYKEELKGYFRL